MENLSHLLHLTCRKVCCQMVDYLLSCVEARSGPQVWFRSSMIVLILGDRVLSVLLFVMQHLEHQHTFGKHRSLNLHLLFWPSDPRILTGLSSSWFPFYIFDFAIRHPTLSTASTLYLLI